VKILITGGTGLIGRELTRVLLLAGHEVVILSRNSQTNPDIPQGVRMLHWDGKTSQGWADGLEGAQAVINMAGENIAGSGFFPKRWTPERKRIIYESRINAGKAIVEAITLVKNKPTVLIQSSAIDYYGPLPDQSIDEDQPAGNDFFSRVCQDWEDSTKSVTSLGVRHVVTRTGVILTARGGALTRLLLPYKLFAGGPFGNGKQVLSWIHMSDVIGAIQFLINDPASSGVYNLTAPNPVTNSQIGKAIAKTLHRPYWLPVPGFIMRLLFGEVATVVLDGQRVIPKRLQESGYIYKFSEINTALGDILNG